MSKGRWSVWFLVLWVGWALALEPVRIDEVRIEGNSRVEEEAIRVHLGVEAGSVLDEKLVDDDVRAIYRMGFFEDVSAELLDENGKKVLVYRVRERPVVREIRIEGEKALDREELEAALKVRPNTILDPVQVRKGIENAKKEYEKKGYLDARIDYEVEPVGPGQVDLVFRVDEGKRIRVAEIVFEGVRAMKPRELRGVMQTKKKWFLSFLTGSGNLDREVLKADIERLTAFYYDHGFIDVKIDEPVVERTKDGLRVTIKIDEGERYRVGKVRIAGDLLPENERLLRRLELKEGDTFRASLLRKDIDFLTERYGDHGYAFVNVTPETSVDPEKRTVDVTYVVRQGPVVYFRRIEITGNTKTRDKVIRRELEVAEQQRFSGRALRRSQERVRRLGFFQEVNFTTRKADENQLDLLVDVKEGPTGSFAAGAGISSGESFLFNVRLAEINLFGRGQRVVLNADFGSIRQNFSLSFTEPYLFDTPLTAGVEAFRWRLDFLDFTRSGTGGGLRFLYPLPALGYRSFLGFPLRDTRVGLEYRFEQAEISNVSAAAATVIRAEQGTELTSSVTPRLFRDTRNHPFDPTAGSMQDLSVELAGLGGTSRFFKAEARGRWYYPFYRNPDWGTFVFSTGLTLAFGRSFAGKSRELPLFERYFPGGINSVRGFDVRTLGPRVPVFDERGRLVDIDPIGGSQEFVGNFELIFPLAESVGLRGVVFFDAGEAFRATEWMDPADLRLAYGVGIRWLSPIGPLRFEVGFPINRRADDSARAINFTFGGPP
ncbi:MAG: outer membrane protein assembly factor BamA [Candidatus Binatia bacterium]|nr:MAG: outer membrane protein assembly factor BamA [Candidatus Binatia bacterium]